MILNNHHKIHQMPGHDEMDLNDMLHYLYWLEIYKYWDT